MSVKLGADWVLCSISKFWRSLLSSTRFDWQCARSNTYKKENTLSTLTDRQFLLWYHKPAESTIVYTITLQRNQRLEFAPSCSPDSIIRIMYQLVTSSFCNREGDRHQRRQLALRPTCWISTLFFCHQHKATIFSAPAVNRITRHFCNYYPNPANTSACA